eukprot:CAMPEP_0194523084 /NCGR_PEP_ID=MMETSP0253-20130528/57872_1 /TAXON_ID=2966 /ORGANISM="Noctiluca scintillans" /LENGTH=495 /DNA_ID=CAMNT_0039367585 /DNA_START=46 /DNA_END=1530 /DNA_ORIENTATION=-
MRYALVVLSFCLGELVRCGALRLPGGEEGAELEHKQRLLQIEALTNGSDVNVLRRRSDVVRSAARHVWRNYRGHAWGRDNLLPLSGTGRDGEFKHAVTMIDGLDSLWIMGLHAEFQEAREWIATNLQGRFEQMTGGSTFETTIRTLGGLLSAYDLSADEVFLDAAKLLASRINENVTEKGVSANSFGSNRTVSNTLARSGTVQLEMRYLSHVTGDASYARKVDRFYETVRARPALDGLWPNNYAHDGGKASMGGEGDSFYEYLLKAWLISGKNDTALWQMYDDASMGLEKHMVQRGADGLLYVGDLYIGPGNSVVRYTPTMQHLSCFVVGWLALGAAHRQDAEVRARHTRLASSIAETCWEMYHQQPTGLAPEYVSRMEMDLRSTEHREYLLRPEAVEGWFYMNELTDDTKYREWGWNMFQSIEKELWTPNGYASHKDVRVPSTAAVNGTQLADRMESFFLAETLKYLFLLQDPDHTMKLDKYVFNTEAHPLSMW